MDAPPVYYGECSFTLNGVVQTNFRPQALITIQSVVGNNIDLGFVYFDSQNFARYGLGFNPISMKETTYIIKHTKNQIINNIFDKTISFYNILGGDLVGPTYEVDSTKPCVLNITRVDSTTKELWGTFYGTYELPANIATPANNPRVVTITNGSFHTKVLE